jgi:hypothetical protein
VSVPSANATRPAPTATAEPALEPPVDAEPVLEGPSLEELVPEAPAPPRERRSRPKDPRHVRAIPTNAQVKVERAVEIFNESEHPRTIAGIARSLGEPWVNVTVGSAPSEVSVVVAWELSWYRYRIDLGDEADAVAMLDKGEEMDQIDDALRDWNATLDADGRVLVGAGREGGSEA